MKKSLKEEFDSRTEPIILEPYKFCKYKSVCPFTCFETEYPCEGCNRNRNSRFICDIKKLKENI